MNTPMNWLRIFATVAIPGLTAAFAYYPKYLWIPCVISALGVLSTNVVPSISQLPQSIKPSTPADTENQVETPLKKMSGQPFTGE